ncbi:MAG: hypothetical protein SGI71_06660 [Verrucomicrobiota bacterium]|nr:hypothetical protein [Verrucomicrobiota bacterium]
MADAAETLTANAADNIKEAIGNLFMGLAPLSLPSMPSVFPAPQLDEADKESASEETAKNESPYQWKENITTTVFWVGEPAVKKKSSPANIKSAWDGNWQKNYGGLDDPKNRVGYFPSKFRPKQNPFYVALPFNDLHDKKKSKAIIPWAEDLGKVKGSVCKGQWLAIKHGDKIAYAQWEDVGPFKTKDADYVFGDDSRPANLKNRAAGLDVSPAVRDFLGIQGEAKTSWKFVEDSEVPAGPWKEISNPTPSERVIAMANNG